MRSNGRGHGIGIRTGNVSVNLDSQILSIPVSPAFSNWYKEITRNEIETDTHD